MGTARLPTRLWVYAHLRRCHAEGVPATVARRGDPTGGLVILKLNLLAAGFRVLSQTRDISGNTAWLAALKGAAMDESAADDYIARQVARDPDLWVLEIEHREGWHPFEGKVL
jgi:hypothetical protein